MNTDIGLRGEQDVSGAVIGAAYRVSNTLGPGGLVINFGCARVDVQRVVNCLTH